MFFDEDESQINSDSPSGMVEGWTERSPFEGVPVDCESTVEEEEEEEEEEEGDEERGERAVCDASFDWDGAEGEEATESEVELCPLGCL